MKDIRKKGTWRTEFSMKEMPSMISSSHFAPDKSVKRPRNLMKIRMPMVWRQVKINQLHVSRWHPYGFLAYWYGNKHPDGQPTRYGQCRLSIQLAREDARILESSVGAHHSQLGSSHDAVQLKAAE